MKATGLPAIRTLINHGYHRYARRRVGLLRQTDPVACQHEQLLKLVAQASQTRFGQDHHFDQIDSVESYQKAVPLRNYEAIWHDYLKEAYPVWEDLLWPGRIKYLALTSGTTQGNTKYIPVSRAMISSNRHAARTMLAYALNHRPKSRLFHGKLFLMGGSTSLDQPTPGVFEGDLSAIANMESDRILAPYAFPPLDLALEDDWDRKLDKLATLSQSEPITLVSGVPSWLLMLIQRVLEISGKSTLVEVWPQLEMVVHGGLKFDPYRTTFERLIGSSSVRLQETYPCSEGFIAFGDPVTQWLRLVFDHGLFYEFIPVEELHEPRPTRLWLGNVEIGPEYAIVLTTCAGLWSHIVGDTICFESLAPPLIRFTGRTKYSLSAFGEHLISEEVESAIAEVTEALGVAIREWHVGPVFTGKLGYHQYVVEFLDPQPSPGVFRQFRDRLDTSLRNRNADYDAHRAEGVGIPAPAMIQLAPGSFADWMRSRGKLGGQHKVPRMDGDGTLTAELVQFMKTGTATLSRLEPLSSSSPHGCLESKGCSE